MRVLLVASLLLTALLAGCSDPPPQPLGPVARLDAELLPGTEARIVASVFNVGDAPLTLTDDCREWGIETRGPLGNVTVRPTDCQVPAEVPVGGSAVRTWVWERERLHTSVGGTHTIRETPVEGTYRFEVSFRAPQGPLAEAVTDVQDQIPASALGAEGPGTLGWRLWAWPENAVLENRGPLHVPVAWDPCGIGLSGVNGTGALPARSCTLGTGTYFLRPGAALHAEVEGQGAAAHLVDPQDDVAHIVAVHEGALEGRTWFTGQWHARTGEPVVIPGDRTFRAHDPTRPGIVLIGSMDLEEPFLQVQNDGERAYRYESGCGLPWRSAAADCVPSAEWLAPGEDLVHDAAPPDGTYAFIWGRDAGAFTYAVPSAN